MELEQLRQLVAIEEEGTISGAAERIHLTQPSLSRSMKRLEADLGIELFDRTVNRVALNDAGRLAVEGARDVLAAEQRLRDTLDNLSRRHRTLKVAAVAPAPVWHLTARVVERFGGIVLEPDLLPEQEIERRLFSHTTDLAVTRRPIALPNCRCVPLMTESLFLLAPKEHPLASRAQVSFADMAGEDFLVFERIGFWKDVYERAIPNVHAVTQKDREVFLQLVRTSDMLCFTTDAPQNTDGIPGRVAVPISDADAHATFFLVALADAPSLVSEIVDWMAATGSSSATRRT